MVLKDPEKLREEWMIKPFFDYLSSKSERLEHRHLIKVMQGPTGMGKTFSTTYKFIPHLFENGVELVVYSAPNVENIDCDSFSIAGQKHNYIFTRSVDTAFRMLKQGIKVVLGLTHSYLCNTQKKCRLHRQQLIDFGHKSALFIEECHSWLGVTEQQWYQEVIGHATPSFGGSAYKFSKSILEKTDLVFGITATPTKQHRGVVGDGCFYLLNDLCPVNERPLLTKWGKNYNEYPGYVTENYNGKDRIVIDRQKCEEVFENYVTNHHISNIKKLEDLRRIDYNVIPKLSSLIICGGNNNNRLSIHVNDAVEMLSDILYNNGYSSACQWISIMTHNKKGFYNLEGDFTSASEDDILDCLNDKDSDCQFLLVNNKAKAGINVFNFTGICSLRIRDPKTTNCTELSRQIIGRASRLNSGHGNILSKKYGYDMRKMCMNYCKDYDVDTEVFYKTLSIANSFEFHYPSTPHGHWELTVEEFNKYYTAPWNEVQDIVKSLITLSKFCVDCPAKLFFQD